MPLDLNEFIALVRQYSDFAYGLMFTYAASNSMLMLLFAGYTAQLAGFDWATLVVACWAGGCAGDMVRFWIGRRFGPRLLARFPRIARSAQTVVRLVDRHYILLPMTHRYPNVIRSVGGFAFGLSRLPSSTFLALNVVSAGVWAFAVVTAGYAFAHLSDRFLSGAASGVGIAAMVVFLGLSWLLSRRLDRVVEKG